MSSRTSDILRNLPSASDLLAKPPLSNLVARFNQSAVATGVRQYLDDLRSELRQRASDASLPSLSELAESAARYFLDQQRHGICPVVNATGRFLDPRWQSVPLADVAVQSMAASASHFTADLREVLSADSANAESEPATLLRALTGAEDALLVHSNPLGIWLATNVLAAGRDVLVSRGQVVSVTRDSSLSELLEGGGARLREVGTVDRTRAADYEAALGESTAMIVRSRSDRYRHVDGQSFPALEELIALARDRELVLLDALDGAATHESVNDNEVSGGDQGAAGACVTAAASLALGADLVMLRGDGRLGGPPCGIVLGRKELLAQIRRHVVCAACALDPYRAAAMTETLRAYRDSAARHRVPLVTLSAAAIENLQHRAEHLAPQLVNSDIIVSATAVPIEGPSTPQETHAAPAASQPSYGVALVPADDDVNRLDDWLRRRRCPVLGRCEGNRVLLDLRTVLPGQDQILSDMIAERGGG